jgi:hypothetical protein
MRQARIEAVADVRRDLRRDLSRFRELTDDANMLKKIVDNDVLTWIITNSARENRLSAAGRGEAFGLLL